MKKHLLRVIGILAISASAYAIAPDQLRPPITEGVLNAGSTTEVRVTANVVASVAVNEASPIDFGNLVRGDGVYREGEKIKEITPGLVTFRAKTSTQKVFAALNTDMIDLHWQHDNGSTNDGSETSTQLKKVRVTGLSVYDDTKLGQPADPQKGMEEVKLTNGQAKRQLHAWFYAYDDGQNGANGKDYTTNKESGNLGNKQKLGSYLGNVTVVAYLK